MWFQSCCDLCQYFYLRHTTKFAGGRFGVSFITLFRCDVIEMMGVFRGGVSMYFGDNFIFLVYVRPIWYLGEIST